MSRLPTPTPTPTPAHALRGVGGGKRGVACPSHPVPGSSFPSIAGQVREIRGSWTWHFPTPHPHPHPVLGEGEERSRSCIIAYSSLSTYDYGRGWEQGGRGMFSLLLFSSIRSRAAGWGGTLDVILLARMISRVWRSFLCFKGLFS